MFEQNMDYFCKQDTDKLTGFLVYKDLEKVSSCLILYSDGFGLRDYFKDIAKQFVNDSIAVFCADFFGDQKSFRSHSEAISSLTFLRNHKDIFRRRSVAAVDFVKKYFNKSFLPIVTMGYCFGAAAALEVMRSGCELKGVITFHGNLLFDTKMHASVFKPKVLVLHGAKDPFISDEEIDGFKKEMEASQANLTFVSFAQAVHGFTNPNAGDNRASGIAYDREVHYRSYAYAKQFIAE